MMKKINFIYFLLIILIFVQGCHPTKTVKITETSAERKMEEEKRTDMSQKLSDAKALSLYINDEYIPVIWEENDTVNELQDEVSNHLITVSMSRYGGNEQVGSLGRSFITNDDQIVTHNGDIVLYNGSNIVVFYGSNSWAYTRLGKIDLTGEEVKNLLSKEDVLLSLQ